MELDCMTPGDCQSGLVCCVGGSGNETCRPDPLCPGDGNPTYRICDTNADCPRNAASCLGVSGADGGSSGISFCF